MNREERRTATAVVATLAIVTAGVVAVTAWAIRPFTVHGRSMEPTLRSGDRVLVDLRAYRHDPPLVGDLVLVRVPHGPTVVKRVAGLPEASDGAGRRVWVLGDNPSESLDSRAFGAIPADRVVGRAVLRYWPPSRFGSIE